MKAQRPKFNTILNVIIALLVGYLLMTLVHIQTNNAKTLQGIKRIQADQQRLLTAQAQSDKAQKLDSEKKLDILICLVLLPQDQRTLDTANNCRQQATATVSSDGTPVGTASNTSRNTATASSPQPAPQTTTSQPTSSQPSGDTAPQPSLIQRLITNVKGML